MNVGWRLRKESFVVVVELVVGPVEPDDPEVCGLSADIRCEK